MRTFKKKLLFVALTISCLNLHAQHSFDGGIKNNSLAISPDESIAIASNSDSLRVKVYDLKTNKCIKNIEGFVNPRNILFSPNGKQFYITDSSLGLLLVFSTTELKVIKTYPIGYGAFGSAINKAGTLIFINNEATNTVSVLDLTTQSIKSIITGFAQPRQGIKLSPDNTKVYVTNFANDRIYVVDIATLSIESTIEGFNKIRAISILKNGSKLFAANSGTNTIAVVDIATKKIVKLIPVGKDPYGATLSPDETILLSGNKIDNSLTLIDVASLEPKGTITGFKEPRQALIFSKSGELVYVLNNDLSVNVLKMTDRKIIKTVF